jgi:hypothetical protein
MRAERGSKVATRGESEDTDAVRVDVPFGSVSANDAERALCVLKRCR